MDFILNNLAVLIIFWFAFAILTSIFARSKNRSPIYWVMLGAIFGIFGLLLILILPKKPKYTTKEPLDKMDAELKYLQMKKDYLESKSNESA